MYCLEHKNCFKKVKTIQPSIAAYFYKIGNKAEEVLTCLTAVDHIPFATLANSKDIKNDWKAQGLKIPDDQHQGSTSKIPDDQHAIKAIL